MTDTKNLPLIILGLDAGDPDLIERWVKEGRLPTIASIMERGCWGRTGGPEMIIEHGVWFSLFSGYNRSQSGNYYFRELKPYTYDLQLITERDLEIPPFWASLLDSNKSVAIIDPPDFNPLNGLKGFQIANWAVFNPTSSPSALPDQLLKDIQRTFGASTIIDEKVKSNFLQDKRIYRRLMERIEKKGALCRHIFGKDNFDLGVAVFSESHPASHQFWKYHAKTQELGIGSKENELTNAIRNVYQAIDRQMGLILSQAPEEANVFIVSSVGIKEQYPTDRFIEDFLVKLGYKVPPKPAKVSFKPMALLRRALPESWRITLSRLLPRETRERLLADQFRNGADWRKTTAFAIPSFYDSFIRVNLKGREPGGIVEPGAEYNTLLGRLEADLKLLVDPQTGKPAVRQITRTSELFGCDPHSSLPDIFVEWDSGHGFMKRVTHPKVDLHQPVPEFFRGTDHSRNGFVASAGPSINGRGDIGDISLLDLAPTFLSLIGEPCPPELTGKIIGAKVQA